MLNAIQNKENAKKFITKKFIIYFIIVTSTVSKDVEIITQSKCESLFIVLIFIWFAVMERFIYFQAQGSGRQFLYQRFYSSLVSTEGN